MSPDDLMQMRDNYAAAARRQIEIARAGVLPAYGWPISRADQIAMRNLAWQQIAWANECYRRAKGGAP